MPFGGELWSICCLRNISEDTEMAIFPLRAKDFHISLKATDVNIWHEDVGVFACSSFTFQQNSVQQSSNRSPLNLLFALWNISMFQEKKKRYPKNKTITQEKNLKNLSGFVSFGFVTSFCIMGTSAAQCYIPDRSVWGSYCCMICGRTCSRLLRRQQKQMLVSVQCSHPFKIDYFSGFYCKNTLPCVISNSLINYIDIQ